MTTAGTTIPLFPLGSPLFPAMVLPLHIFEERYRALIRDLLAGAEAGKPAVFGVVAIRSGVEVGSNAATALADVGCLADLRAVGSLPDGRFEIVTVGFQRFHVDRIITTGTPYLRAEVHWLDEQLGTGADALAARVRAAFHAYREALRNPVGDDELPDDPTRLSYTAAAAMILPPADRQRLLATPDTAGRLRLLLQLLAREQAIIGQLHAVPSQGVLRIVTSPN